MNHQMRYFCSVGCCLLLFACSSLGDRNITPVENVSMPPNISSYHQLNQSFENILDEETALAAVDDFEAYVNAKVNKAVSIISPHGRIRPTSPPKLSMKQSVKERLAYQECYRRGFIEPPRSKEIVMDGLSEKEQYQLYSQQQSEYANSGLTANDVSFALNSSTSRDIVPITSEEVAIARDTVLEKVPAAGDSRVETMSPLESLVVAYAIVSDDDGSKPDGQVHLNGTAEEISQFVDIISE